MGCKVLGDRRGRRGRSRRGRAQTAPAASAGFSSPAPTTRPARGGVTSEKVRPREGIGGFRLRQREFLPRELMHVGEFIQEMMHVGEFIQALMHVGEILQELMHVDEGTFQALMQVVKFMLPKKRCRESPFRALFGRFVPCLLESWWDSAGIGQFRPSCGQPMFGQTSARCWPNMATFWTWLAKPWPYFGRI